MPAKLNLKFGDKIGGNNINLIYICDVERKNKTERRVLVYDTDYDEYFEGNLGELRHKKIRHSFDRGRKITNQKNTTWVQGEHRKILGQEILFVKETDTIVYPSGQKCRFGVFKNLNTGSTFSSRVSYVIEGKSLGAKRSRGELKVEEILKSLDINFITEYSFDDFINKGGKANFPFDFYLPDYNCCIEYDGEQHFEGWYRKQENLKHIQERDARKNQYCIEHGIKLIRIPYMDFNKLDEQYILDELGKNGNVVVTDGNSTPIVNVGK